MDVVRKEAESCDCLQGMGQRREEIRGVVVSRARRATDPFSSLLSSPFSRLPNRPLARRRHRVRHGHPAHLQDSGGVPRPHDDDVFGGSLPEGLGHRCRALQRDAVGAPTGGERGRVHDPGQRGEAGGRREEARGADGAPCLDPKPSPPLLPLSQALYDICFRTLKVREGRGGRGGRPCARRRPTPHPLFPPLPSSPPPLSATSTTSYPPSCRASPAVCASPAS